MLCDHDDQGSFALILNKPTEIYLNIKDFSISDQQSGLDDYPLWYGGPVQMEQCFYLFRHEEAIQGAELVIDDLYLASAKDTLNKLFASKERENIFIKFFLGYAGWSFYQLDCEVSYGWWLMNQGESHSPFTKDHKKQWLEQLKKIDHKLYLKGLSFIDSGLSS